MWLQSLTEKLELNGPIDKVFHYFTDTEQIAKNLPPSTKLQILQRTSKHLSQGVTIDFCAKLLGFPIHWRSYVHSFSVNRHIAYMWQKNRFFTSWEHDYYFEPISNNKTRVTECIIYRLPCGPLGLVVDRLVIRPFLLRTFAYRRKALIANFQILPTKSSKTASSVK
jgi:ligand-binding SRPBCC domain-containing protein